MGPKVLDKGSKCCPFSVEFVFTKLNGHPIFRPLWAYIRTKVKLFAKIGFLKQFFWISPNGPTNGYSVYNMVAAQNFGSATFNFVHRIFLDNLGSLKEMLTRQFLRQSSAKYTCFGNLSEVSCSFIIALAAGHLSS